MQAAWRDAQQGRFSFHAQVGHPLGVPDFAYPGELALGVELADPSGQVQALQRQVAAYPPALTLTRAVVPAAVWEAGFCLEIAAKALPRGDTTYVAGCLFLSVGLCAHALHAVAGRWLVNQKGAVAAAARLPGVPPRFAARAHGVLAHLGREPEHLRRALNHAAALVGDVCAACNPAVR